VTIADTEARIRRFHDRFELVTTEVKKAIVGNDQIIESMLTALLVKGHVLLEGIPGLGKTSLVHTLSRAMHLEFSRIQFTPDLMPGDILGTHVFQETPGGERSLVFQPGPLFANVVLADEINRATPKTQSALLEAMQEKTITIGRTSHPLVLPFFVLATQNPLEMEGTYPLPEAQLDRFIFKLKMTYPDADELHEILDRTTSEEEPTVEAVLDRDDILEMRQVARSLPVSREVQDYAIRLVMATHPESPQAHEQARRYVRFGASPRGVQAVILAGKVHALLRDRAWLSCEDVRAVALPALRHRLLLNFEGEAQRVDTDDVLGAVIEDTPESRP
jgi:MoxR-like ATPase